MYRGDNYIICWRVMLQCWHCHLLTDIEATACIIFQEPSFSAHIMSSFNSNKCVWPKIIFFLNCSWPFLYEVVEAANRLQCMFCSLCSNWCLFLSFLCFYLYIFQCESQTVQVFFNQVAFLTLCKMKTPFCITISHLTCSYCLLVMDFRLKWCKYIKKMFCQFQ